MPRSPAKADRAERDPAARVCDLWALGLEHLLRETPNDTPQPLIIGFQRRQRTPTTTAHVVRLGPPGGTT